MTYENVVAVFDQADDADAAIGKLKASGVPSSDISRHQEGSTTTDVALTQTETTSFWGNLFGTAAPHNDRPKYEQAARSGGIVVTVHVPEERGTEVADIIDQYNPIDIEERFDDVAPLLTTTAFNRDDAQRLTLSEEELVVGKREVQQGTTRVRRYTVTTPVEQQVNLREETVSVQRRPVSDNRAVTDDAWTDKTIDVVEMGEEAVVGKTARIKEEILIRKDIGERTETIRDSVRSEDVEIEEIPARSVKP